MDRIEYKNRGNSFKVYVGRPQRWSNAVLEVPSKPIRRGSTTNPNRSGQVFCPVPGCHSLTPNDILPTRGNNMAAENQASWLEEYSSRPERQRQPSTSISPSDGGDGGCVKSATGGCNSVRARATTTPVEYSPEAALQFVLRSEMRAVRRGVPQRPQFENSDESMRGFEVVIRTLGFRGRNLETEVGSLDSSRENSNDGNAEDSLWLLEGGADALAMWFEDLSHGRTNGVPEVYVTCAGSLLCLSDLDLDRTCRDDCFQ